MSIVHTSQAPQQQQPPQLFVQSSVSSSLITGTSLLPQQQQLQHHPPSLANTNPLALAPLPPPPEEEIDLPLNWKTARDPNGKIYYYHAITRKTQWERPTDKDAEGTITMDLGTPEPESESEGEVSKFVLTGPRTPPDFSEGDERMPHTPEGSPPAKIPQKRHKGQRNLSPTRSSSSRPKRPRSKLKHKRPSSRSKSLKVKGPRTPSPPPSGRSPKQLQLTPKKLHTSSPPHKEVGHAPLTAITSSKQDELSTLESPRTSQLDKEISRTLEMKSSATESSDSQVEIIGSNDSSFIPKPDSPKLQSPIRIPAAQHSPPTLSPPLSSSQEHSPLDLSIASDPGEAEPQDLAPPPRKKHKGEGRTKRKASKAKEEYRHKVCTCLSACVWTRLALVHFPYVAILISFLFF